MLERDGKAGLLGVVFLMVIGVAIGCGVLADPLSGAIVAGAAIVLLLGFTSPWSVVALLLALTPFRILWWGAGGISPVEVIYSFTFLALVGCWIVRYVTDAVMNGAVTDVKSPLVPPLILFFVTALFSAFLAVTKHRPFEAWGSHLNLISFFALYFVVTGHIRSLKDLNRIFIVFFLVSAIAVIRGIFYQLIARPYNIEILGASIPKLAMANAAGFIILMMLIPFAVLVKNARTKFFYISTVLFFGIHQVLTFVRARWIGGIAGTVFLFLVLSPAKRMRFLKFILVVVLLAVIYIHACSMFPSEHIFFRLPRVTEERFLSIFRPTEEITAITRFSEWRAVIEKIRQHPFLGNGLGNRVSYISYDQARRPLEVSSYIHNSYLFYYMNMGLLGLIAILWLSIAFIFYGLRVYRDTEELYYKAFVLGSVAAFFSMAVVSFIGPDLSYPGRTMVIGFLMGAVALIDKLKNNKPAA